MSLETISLESISIEAEAALRELAILSSLKPGDLVVIGCSTSEVKGERIGSSTSLEIAEALFEGFNKAATATGVALAFQCCEHLNRALVVTEATSERFHLDAVRVIPVPKAGGAMASYAFQKLPQAVMVESLQQRACAGLDVGDTLIGMHLHPVVVPLRLLEHKQIGAAHLVAATSRAKLIGGQRAVYDKEVALEQLKMAGYKAE